MMLPTSANVTIDLQTTLPKNAEAVVIFAAEGGKISGDTALVLGSAEFENAQRMIRLGVVKGKAREVDFDLLESPRGTFRRIYVAGLGDSEKCTPENVRTAAGAVMKTLRKHRINRVAVVPPVVNRGRDATGSQVAVEGMLLAAFDWREYRGKAPKDQQGDQENDRQKSMNVTILSSRSAQKAITAAVNRARLLSDAQNFARTIAFRPGNDVNPPRLAQIAQQACKEVGLRCRVLDEKQMQRMGMGGICAVG